MKLPALPGNLRRAIPFALIGAAVAYFLDPRQGNRRRKQAAGAVQRAAHPQSAQEPPGDDITLARKVETEIFRPADAPKGQVNVSVESGIVSLRGQVDDDDQIDELVGKASTIPGVKAVENLLHTPGTEAPTRSS
jgi:osmotically-inducible protein OsmY